MDSFLQEQQSLIFGFGDGGPEGDRLLDPDHFLSATRDPAPTAASDFSYISCQLGDKNVSSSHYAATLASFPKVMPVFLPPNQGLQGIQQHFDYPVVHHQPGVPEFTMPSETHYNYPPLDNLGALTNAQPYLPQDRDFQIPEYEQQLQDAQHEQRYPSPPVAMADNPYAAQSQTPAPVENPADLAADAKSESDAPSPGRSKPVPKPDREVTKNANGKFVCKYPGCTEEHKEFGRKCEWRFV